jgi:hypothetical protein
MTNPIVKIHNAETGEIIEREMNAQELKQFEKDGKAANDKAAADATKAADKAALLAKLGISEDEAKLLLS